MIHAADPPATLPPPQPVRPSPPLAPIDRHPEGGGRRAPRHRRAPEPDPSKPRDEDVRDGHVDVYAHSRLQ